MVEQIIGGTHDPSKDMYWIQDDDEDGLCWSPGRVVEVRAQTFVLECIVSNDHFEIEKDDPAVVHPSCLGKFIFAKKSATLTRAQFFDF